MEKSSIRAIKREQRRIKGYTISKRLYYDIFEDGKKEIHHAIEDCYHLFLFGDYGLVSVEETTANRRARRIQQGLIRAVYNPYGIEKLFFVFDYRRHKNGLIRVMYISEAQKCNKTYLDLL